MKSKLTRIMGVALALVLVFGLGAAFIPVNTPGGPDTAQAGDLSWGGIGLPSGTGSVLVGQDENLGPVAISPNFANDNTVWAVVNDLYSPATPVVYKSTNGGHTWTATTSTLGAAGDVGIALEVSDNYATDNTVFVVTQRPGGGAGTGIVYRSVNGGSSFGQLGVVTLGVDEVITSFDVSPDYNGTGVLAVGIADIASGVVPATANTCVQVWGVNSVLSWTVYGDVAAVDISAIEFSPNYAMDSTILCVSSAAGAQPQLRSIVGGTWDTIAATNVGATAVTDVDLQKTGVATDLIAADIALPSDYNGQVATTRRAYVSIVGEAGAAATAGNVYRITNVTAGTAIATSAAILLSNIKYSGDFAGGTLIGGLWAAAGGTKCDVYRTTNPTSSVVNWYAVSGAANKPDGTTEATMTDNTTAWVAMSANFANDSTVVCGTQGDDSAFNVSTNGAASFNAYGLIDNSAAGGAGTEGALGTITDIDLSPNFASDGVVFMVSENDNAVINDSNVWVRNGSYWERCFTANFATAGTGVVECSAEYASDSAVWAAETGNGAQDIWYSSNGGQSWSARNCGVLTGIQTVGAPDASTVYVGDSASGNVAKSVNSGWTWPTSLRKASGAATRVASLKVQDSTVLVGGGAGTVRRSDDGGATWGKISTTLTGNVYVDFDGTTVYAVETGSGNVYRSVDAGGWKEIGAATTATANPGNDAIEMILADDGTLYYLEIGGADVQRSINPTAAVPTPDVTWQGMTLAPAVAGAAMDVVTGASNIVCVLTTTPAIRIYTDTLSAGTAGPSLVAPADGSTLTRAQTTRFTIEAMPGVTTYGHQWSTDSTFASATTDTVIAAPAVQTAGLAITEGATVYWRVRATAPFNSPWSEVWTVETQITTAVQAPIPAYPAGDDVMDIALKPVFNWGAFKYASGYEFQLANDSGMTDLLVDLSGDSALGNTTSYVITDELSYSSTYYWRVRAIKGTATAYSDWSAIVGFTTMAEPVEPVEPAPIVIPPTPVEPTATPGYIWAIIAIGAILAIVVIVLIVRTRRIA